MKIVFTGRNAKKRKTMLLRILEEYRSKLIMAFINKCNGNDFNTLSLIKISEIMDDVHNDFIERF